MWIVHHASNASLLALEDAFYVAKEVDGQLVWENPLWLDNMKRAANGGLVPPIDQFTHAGR